MEGTAGGLGTPKKAWLRPALAMAAWMIPAVLGIGGGSAGLAAQANEQSRVGQAVLGTCGEIDPSTGVVAGTVRDHETGVPLEGAAVTASWQGPDSIPMRDNILADYAGFFVFCGVPSGLELELEAEALGVHVGPVITEVEAGTLVVERLALPLSDSRSPGYITGQIVSRATGDGVPNALVTVPELALTTITNDEGLFYLQEMPFGIYTIEIEHIAHAKRSVPARVAGGLTHNMQIELDVEAIELGGIEVTVETKRFYMDREGLISRMNLGFGDFYTRADIERIGTSSIAELLGRTAGVRSFNNGAGLYIRGRACVPMVFVDGLMWSLDERMGLKDLSTFNADVIEFYKGTASIPAEFNFSTNATDQVGCGAIVIWTRRGRES